MAKVDITLENFSQELPGLIEHLQAKCTGESEAHRLYETLEALKNPAGDLLTAVNLIKGKPKVGSIPDVVIRVEKGTFAKTATLRVE